MKPRSAAKQRQFKPQQVLHRITNRIRQSLKLEEILRTTALEVRSFMKTDRVKIYRFHPDASGEVLAEAIQGDRHLSRSTLFDRDPPTRCATR